MSETNINKRIAKNTLALYIRMFFVMCVTLYTSRVILQVLGVDDFGIYNVVGGVVVLFSFFSSIMTSATQRFLNVSLSSKDSNEVQKIFSTSLVMHLYLLILIIVISETVGLWFLTNKLNIPSLRLDAAIYSYHLSILTTCVGIMIVPFRASIIAYEKMSFFAYSGIVEVLLKLLIVWLLLFSDDDRLVYYSFLLLFINIIILFWYILYVKSSFAANRLIFKYDKKIGKSMLSFSGWTLFGGIADVGYKQGSLLILNIFYGVAVNAALGIVNQIRTAVFTLTSNLQVAANPQIIKQYARGDYASYVNLVFNISKYSYFLMLIVCFPLILNIDFILNIWLITPPSHTRSFAVLILIFGMIDSLNGPLWTTMQATGNIKSYQIVTSFLLLLNLPLSYWALSSGGIPECIIVIQIILLLFILIVRLIFSNVYAKIDITQYLCKVITPILIVTLFTIPVPMLLSSLYSGFLGFIITCLSSVIFSVIFIYNFGLQKNEKIFLKTKIKNKIY